MSFKTMFRVIRQAPSKSYLRWVTWLPALMPAALALLYVSLAAHFRLASGHWPSMMSEDFSSTAFTLHERLTLRFAFLTLLAPPAWVAMLLSRPLRRPLKTHGLQLAVYVAGWLLVLLMIHYDPTPFSDWFFD